MSCGVSIHTRMFLHRIQTAVVMTTEKIRASQPLFATKRLRALSFFSPNFCATGMAKPLHTPRQKPMIIKLMDPVEPTAASACTPRHLPTMMVSAIL